MKAANGRAMKAKGSAFERAVVEYLRGHGFPYAERYYGAGRHEDRGDIAGVVGWTVEAKACRTFDLAGWADEASRERDAASSRYAAVVVKRPRRPIQEAYVVLSLATWAELLGEDQP